jgi:hypothetical protein
MQAPPPDQPVVVKKRPGRPRKHPLPQSQPTVLAAYDGEGGTPQLQPKQQEGSSLERAAAVAAAAVAPPPTAAAGLPPPKKRGRPRKHPLPATDEDAPGAKQQRGTPPSERQLHDVPAQARSQPTGPISPVVCLPAPPVPSLFGHVCPYAMQLGKTLPQPML